MFLHFSLYSLSQTWWRQHHAVGTLLFFLINLEDRNGSALYVLTWLKAGHMLAVDCELAPCLWTKTLMLCSAASTGDVN